MAGRPGPEAYRTSSISPLDDEVFIIYQWAADYGIPISFLYINNPQGLPLHQLTVNEVKNISEIYFNLYQRNQSLAQIAQALSLTETTTAMIFVNLAETTFDQETILNQINAYFLEVGFIPYRTLSS